VPTEALAKEEKESGGQASGTDGRTVPIEVASVPDRDGGHWQRPRRSPPPAVSGTSVCCRARHDSSILIRTLAKLCQHDILSVAAKYGISRLDNSVSSIKKSMWQTFAASVVEVFLKCFLNAVCLCFTAFIMFCAS